MRLKTIVRYLSPVYAAKLWSLIFVSISEIILINIISSLSSNMASSIITHAKLSSSHHWMTYSTTNGIVIFDFSEVSHKLLLSKLYAMGVTPHTQTNTECKWCTFTPTIPASIRKMGINSTTYYVERFPRSRP